MDRFKLLFRVANTLALFLIAGALLVERGVAAPTDPPATALGTQFVYEGRLGTVSGPYDFQFRLFTEATGGTVIGSPNLINDTAVDTGEYRVVLNFGANAFTGAARYLEVGYRPGTSTAAYKLAAARIPIIPTAYALSLRPGAIVSGNQSTPSLQVFNAANADGIVGTGGANGVKGRSANPGASGVYGENTSTGYGVAGRSTAGGTGAYGESTSGIGVLGMSHGFAAVQGTNTGLGLNYGVYGYVNSASGSGVYGLNEGTGYGIVGRSLDGAGVYGSSQNGFAMQASGHTRQLRHQSGWVKAMAIIDPARPAAQRVLRCFNSQVAATSATTAPCGISVVHDIEGAFYIDFNFRVNDRFAVVSAYNARTIGSVSTSGTNQLYVTMYAENEGEYRNYPFTIVVY